jgi:glutathione S-transferase
MEESRLIELYHHGSSVCAAKMRLTLAEKQLECKGHYADILKGDQFVSSYVRLNPKAVVPTLIHHNKPILESTVICEYLDEVFAGCPLKPANALDRAEMRIWTKAVDELLHPMCAEITFAASHPDGQTLLLVTTANRLRKFT